MTVIFKSLDLVSASETVAESVSVRFGVSAVDLGFERSIVAYYVTGWMNSNVGQHRFRSHFGSSHFLCDRAWSLPVHDLCWFCLVQVSTTQLPTCSHDTSKRRNKCADFSGRGLFFDFGFS